MGLRIPVLKQGAEHAVAPPAVATAPATQPQPYDSFDYLCLIASSTSAPISRIHSFIYGSTETYLPSSWSIDHGTFTGALLKSL